MGKFGYKYGCRWLCNCRSATPYPSMSPTHKLQCEFQIPATSLTNGPPKCWVAHLINVDGNDVFVSKSQGQKDTEGQWKNCTFYRELSPNQAKTLVNTVGVDDKLKKLLRAHYNIKKGGTNSLETMFSPSTHPQSKPKGNGNASTNKKRPTLKDVAGKWFDLCTSVLEIVVGFVMGLCEWMLVYPFQWCTQSYKKAKLRGNNYTFTFPCKCKVVHPNTEELVELPALIMAIIALLVGTLIHKHTWMQHVSVCIATLTTLWIFKPEQRTMVFQIVPLVVTLNAVVLVWASECSWESVMLTVLIQIMLPVSVVEAMNQVTGEHRQSLVSRESMFLLAILAFMFGGCYCVSFEPMPTNYDSAVPKPANFQSEVCTKMAKLIEEEFAEGNHTKCTEWATVLIGAQGNNAVYDEYKCGGSTSGKVFPLSSTGNGVPMPMTKDSMCFFVKQHEKKGITVNCTEFMKKHGYAHIEGFVERQDDEERFVTTPCDRNKESYWRLVQQVCVNNITSTNYCKQRYCPSKKTESAVANYIVPRVVNRDNVPVNGDEVQTNVKNDVLEMVTKNIKRSNQELDDITTDTNLVLLMVLLYDVVVYHTKATSVCGKVRKLFQVGDTIKSSGLMKFILLLQGCGGALVSIGLKYAKLAPCPEMAMFSCVIVLLTFILLCGYKLKTAEAYGGQTSTGEGNNATDDEDENVKHCFSELYELLREIDRIITAETEKGNWKQHFGSVDRGSIRDKIDAYLPKSTWVFGPLRSLTFDEDEYTSPEFKTWVKRSMDCAKKREEISPFVRKSESKLAKIAKGGMQKFLSLLVFIITGLWNFLWLAFHFVKVPAYAQSFVIEFVFMKNNPELINIIAGLFYLVFGVYINGHNVIGMILQLRTVDAANAMALVIMQFEFMNLKIISNSYLTDTTDTKFKGCLQGWAGEGVDLKQYVEVNKGAPLLCLRESAATPMQIFQIVIVIWIGLCIVVTFVEFMLNRTKEFVAKRTAKKAVTGTGNSA